MALKIANRELHPVGELMLFAPQPPELIFGDNPFLHIPDGFLSLGVSLMAWVVTLIVLRAAVQRANKSFDERLAPLAGVMAAFIFAGQMINFPVGAGTSGHLVGATLAFVVLGPWLGLMSMTAVIVLQAMLFQDGGLVVMGGNILVMGIVPGMVGYGIYQLGQTFSPALQTVVGGVGAWLSIVLAALVTAFLLALSGTTSLALAVPALVSVHAIIGIGEALITVAALAFIAQTRPEAVGAEASPQSSKRWAVAGLAIALAITLLAPLASASPDGLEWVAERQGFGDAAQASGPGLLPDYTLPFLGETPLSTIFAGTIGVLVVALLTVVSVRGLGRTAKGDHDHDGHGPGGILHVNTFDRYESGQSIIHRLDPRVKVIVTILFIIANVLLPDGAWLGFAAAWLFVLMVNALAKLPLTYAFKRSFIALPFALAAITVIFTLPGEPVASWEIAGRTLTATSAGIIRFAGIVIRSWLSVQLAILLTAVTHFPDLMHALSHLRIPRILVTIISFMYRYLFVLVDEALRLIRARKARSAHMAGASGGGSIRWRARIAGHMIGQLLVRSLNRSDRVYQAMLARGYDGRLLTLNPHVMGRQDWVLGAVGLLLIATIQFVGRVLI